jgi:hypothetical protein
VASSNGLTLTVGSSSDSPRPERTRGAAGEPERWADETSMKRRTMIGRIMTGALLTFAIPVVAFAQSTTRFDGRLLCSETPSALRQGAFRLPVGRVRLVDGKACVKPFESYRGCEWSVNLTQADKWGAESEFVVAAIEAIHDTPGAQLSVFIFRCRERAYESVFAETFGFRGAGLALGAHMTFDVITGEWLPEDPGCCPSGERRTTYRWDSRRSRFVQVGSKVTAIERGRLPNTQLEPTPRGK